MPHPLGPPTLVYGHRGAAAYAPGNTVGALRLAASQGADGVEIDVRRTRDGALVLHHDPVHALAGPIAQVDLAELRLLAPEVPTFAEAVAAVGPDLRLDVEVKSAVGEPGFDPRRAVAGRVVAALRATGASRRAVITSFDPWVLKQVRHLADDIPTGQLVEPGYDPLPLLERIAAAGHAAVMLPLVDLDDPETIIAAAAEHGLAVVAWTVNDPDDVRRLAAAGVAAVITDDPTTALEALDR